jgi:hypothetical protein
LINLNVLIGLIFLTVFFGPLAVGSFLKLRKGAPPEQRTRLKVIVTMELVGVILGIVGLLTVQGGRRGDIESEYVCQKNMKILAKALVGYSEDWDQTLPPAHQWADLITTHLAETGPKLDKLFRCPAAKSPYSYAYNIALDKMPIVRLKEPKITVMLFESNSTTRNAVGDKSALVPVPRHHGTNNYTFAYGFTKTAGPDTEPTLIWKP